MPSSTCLPAVFNVYSSIYSFIHRFNYFKHFVTFLTYLNILGILIPNKSFIPIQSRFKRYQLFCCSIYLLTMSCLSDWQCTLLIGVIFGNKRKFLTLCCQTKLGLIKFFFKFIHSERQTNTHDELHKCPVCSKILLSTYPIATI